MAEEWSDLLKDTLNKHFTEAFKGWRACYGTVYPDQLIVPPSLEKTARQVLGLSSPDPRPEGKPTLESIIDEQCRKLKEVSYD